VSDKEIDEQEEDFVENIEEETGEETEEEDSQGEYQISADEISRINTTDKIVIFTFDGGSGTQSLERILEILDEYNLKGTFFLTGKWAESNPEYTKSIGDAGHEIFNHTYSHPDLATVTDEEIIDELETGNEKISEITGETTKPFFRPPYGSRNLHIREIAESLGYQDVYWTIDALDWKESTGTTAEYVKSRILDNLAPGNIYLMHIGDNITGNVLEEVILEIQNRGYTIMSLYSAVVEYQ
jgi:peptidoglycan/xylan/chitin deacetylase (PgdA/CDA1 family)